MSIVKIFLDANILFSKAYGSPGLERLWELSKKGRCVLLASGFVIDEAKRNLSEAYQLQRLEACLSDVQLVLEADPTIKCPLDLPDKDRPVFMAAVSAKADYLITGDITHFGKYFGRTIMGVNVCMLRDYLKSVKEVCP